MPAPSRAPRSDPRASTGTPVVWRAGPVTCELRSPHPDVHQRARAILGPWLARSTDLDGDRRIMRFAIESREQDGERRWTVREGDTDIPPAASIDAALTAVEYQAIAALLEPDSGATVLHAALVSRGGRGLLVVGPKEAGKSTLACALWARGWTLHSDDGALIESGALAKGVPRRVSLRSASRELVGDALWKRAGLLPGSTRNRAGLLFHPREADPEAADPEAVGVGAVVFLGRRGSGGAAGPMTPIDPARGLIALAPYCNLRDAGIGRALEALQPLAATARFFDLARGPLPAMSDRAETAIAAAGSEHGRTRA